MELGIFAIKDELAEMWGNPFILPLKVSKRNFDFMAKERSEAECKDQVIYLLGQYDNQTGTITLCKAEPVYNLDKEWTSKHGN